MYFMDVFTSEGEKEVVIFKRRQDPTSIPVEWICWLNGQRKIAPTPEEMVELEARRERIKLNVASMVKEEEEKKLKGYSIWVKSMSAGDGVEETSDKADSMRSTEPTGSGCTFKPGTWQPPT
ncbi:uncharacterized protein LOC130138237 [Syzygium oleosum]|uniref:uncharacterized protein LOC130138237 n=1 Tax=Syzygium oleosum TaxID=219896 RepID=UPI0024BB7624|nr:uncharacterized protein LOC130138237 [Syzygium oleosum]